MTPIPFRTPDALPPGRAPLADGTSAEEVELGLAVAWASLAAQRGAGTTRHVTVLRPVVF